MRPGSISGPSKQKLQLIIKSRIIPEMSLVVLFSCYQNTLLVVQTVHFEWLPTCDELLILYQSSDRIS